LHVRAEIFIIGADLMITGSLPVWVQTVMQTSKSEAAHYSSPAIPNFSGIWGHTYLGFELPVSGPGPVVNKSRRKQVIDADGRLLPPAFGTPYTQSLHVIERYRLLDEEATREALERAGKEILLGPFAYQSGWGTRSQI